MFGPLNWALRVRELCIHKDRTVDTNGEDHTYNALPSDFTDLIPTLPGISTHLLGYNFCGPSKYLYILVPPVATSGARITSVHIFVYGTVELEPGQEQSVSDTESTLNRMEWFRCAILRQTQDGRLVEVSESGFPLRVQFRSVGKRSYGAVHVMEHHHPLTRGLRQGDSIAIWALGKAGYIHKPTGAWIKVGCFIYVITTCVNERIHLGRDESQARIFGLAGCNERGEDDCGTYHVPSWSHLARDRRKFFPWTEVPVFRDSMVLEQFVSQAPSRFLVQ
jgi:hypothetical protein